jgi:uncharacterized hydrophobic protein (TIGR00271 family)
MNPRQDNTPSASNWWRKLLARLPLLSHREKVIVYKQMRNNARADIDFFAMILLSSCIAFFGLLQNSAAVIIGAMLVAPLMSPMIAIGHGIAMGNIRLFRRATRSTLQGMASVIATSALLTLLLPYISLIPPTDEMLARTQPNIIDQYIALASGAAAAYALGRKGVAAALPGVAIAAALVPPLCVAGFGLGSARWQIASGALLLFLTNLAAIVFASATMFMALGFRPTRDERSGHVRRGIAFAVIGMLLVTVPLIIATQSAVQQLEVELIINNALAEIVPTQLGEINEVSIDFNEDKTLITIAFTAYRYREKVSPAEAEKVERQVMQQLQHRLDRELDKPFEIKALIVNSQVKETQ